MELGLIYACQIYYVLNMRQVHQVRLKFTNYCELSHHLGHVLVGQDRWLLLLEIWRVIVI